MIKLLLQITRILIALLVSILLFSCVNTNFNSISGDGNVVTTKRDVANFTNIEAKNGLNVILEQADAFLIEVEADENLQSHIFTEINGETLEIFTDASIYTSEKKEVRIKAPHFAKIDTSSGASVSSKHTISEPKINIESSSGSNINLDVDATAISCDSSSGSSITLSGKSPNVTTESSSGSTIDLSELTSLNATAKSSSGSSTTLQAKQSFNGDASSGSSIVCYGNPTKVIEDESSGGSVSIN